MSRKNFFFIATLGLLSLMFALVWLGNVPFVNAQAPTHVFKGKVSLDGRPAPDGTPLRIFVGGQRIGAADTKAAGGRYVFRVAQPQGQPFLRKSVTFAMQAREGRRWFPQTVEWQPGGETTIDLRVPLPVGVGLDLRPAPPRMNVHVFKGKVSLDGRPAPDGIPLRVFVDGQRIGAADTKAAGGRYAFRVAQPQGQSFQGDIVVFAMQTREGRRWFPQTVEWQPGGETTIDLRVALPVGVGRDILGPLPVQNTPQAEVHVFNGRVVVEGQPASDGTPLRIFVDSQRISKVDTKVTGGQFVFRVAQPEGQSFRGKTVAFAMQTREGRRWFPQTVEWQPGGKTSVVLQDPLPAGLGRDLRGLEPAWNAPQAEARLFKGEVALDNLPAPDGTLIMAFIDGVRVISASTKDGKYEFRVPPWEYTPHKTVAFIGSTVDGRELRFPQTGGWMPGGWSNVHLNLQGASSFPAAEEVAVHVFQGPIILDGRPVPDGTTVVALIGEVRAAGIRTAAGRYRLEVRQPISLTGRTVEFSGWTADGRRFWFYTTGLWQPGGETTIALQGSLGQGSRGPRPDQARNESNRGEDQRHVEIGQDRLTQRERELADREERLRRKVEFNRDQQRREREGSRGQPEGGQPPGIRDPLTPPADERVQTGPTRGFFTNSQIGQLGSANHLFDPSSLAVIGILITLAATSLQMMRGN